MTRLSRQQKQMLMTSTDFPCPFCKEGTTGDEYTSVLLKTAISTETCLLCGKSYNRIYKLMSVKGTK